MQHRTNWTSVSFGSSQYSISPLAIHLLVPVLVPARRESRTPHLFSALDLAKCRRIRPAALGHFFAKIFVGKTSRLIGALGTAFSRSDIALAPHVNIKARYTACQDRAKRKR